MINLFIALLIALGFWGKATKEKDKKTFNSSWWRVGVLAVVTTFVSIFYWKTNEIATIKNNIHVNLVRGSVFKDSTLINDTLWVDSFIAGQRVKYEKVAKHLITDDTIPRDSVIINLLFRFDNYHNFYRASYALGKEDSIDYEVEKYGGMRLDIAVREDSLYQAHTFDDVYNRSFENNGYGNRYCKYYIRYISTRIPSLFVFQPAVDAYKYLSSRNTEDNSQIEFLSLDDYKKTEELGKGAFEYLGQDGVVYHVFAWFENHYNKGVGAWHGIAHRFSCFGINSMNFFTAADLTQCTIDVSLESDCPIAEYNMSFDIPVEFLPVKYKVFEQSPYSIRIIDKPTLHKMNKGIREFHVKFPTMQNLQLIRSLILTTILTSLVSLLCINLYYRIRKHYLKHRSKHRLSYSQAKLFISRWVRIYSRVAICLVLGVILLWSICIGLNYRFFIYISHYNPQNPQNINYVKKRKPFSNKCSQGFAHVRNFTYLSAVK